MVDRFQFPAQSTFGDIQPGQRLPVASRRNDRLDSQGQKVIVATKADRGAPILDGIEPTGGQFDQIGVELAVQGYRDLGQLARGPVL